MNNCLCKWRFIPHPILSEGVFSQIIHKEIKMSSISALMYGQLKEEVEKENGEISEPKRTESEETERIYE